jgi:imidazoleglycerol phosphate synthase glutamine amidotransferase subunit HisH
LADSIRQLKKASGLWDLVVDWVWDDCLTGICLGYQMLSLNRSA